MKGSVRQAVRVLGRFPFARPPHSPLVGRAVNLGGARLLFRRVLDNPAVVRSPLLGAGVLGRWGFLFLNQFGCVSPEIGLTFCYELAGQRWIEGKIDFSSSGTGPSIDHGAYSTLTEFILLKRNVKSSFSCCIFLVWKFQNVVCGFLTKESPLMLMPFDSLKFRAARHSPRPRTGSNRHSRICSPIHFHYVT